MRTKHIPYRPEESDIMLDASSLASAFDMPATLVPSLNVEHVRNERSAVRPLMGKQTGANDH